MSYPYPEDPRLRNHIDKPVLVYDGKDTTGVQAWAWEGNLGDYFQYTLPAQNPRTELPAYSMMVRGSARFWHNGYEGEGGFAVAGFIDKDHNIPYLYKPDGTLEDGPFLIRPVEGVARVMFLEDNCLRISICTVNKFGFRDFAHLDRFYAKGPETIAVPKGSVFFLTTGQMTINGQQFSALEAIEAMAQDVTLDIPVGVYGSVARHE